jgi:hypothetical protein
MTRVCAAALALVLSFALFDTGEKAEGRTFDPRPYLFPAALEAHDDPAQLRVWDAGRGSAKTTTAQYGLLEAAHEVDNCAVVYMVDTAIRAKAIAWPDFVRWNQEYNLVGRTNGTELSITFPNGSRLFVTGADRMDLFDRKRGIKRIWMVVIEEAQDFDSATLKYAVTKVFMPRLGDLELETGRKARIIVAGTGSNDTGYFHELATNRELGFSRCKKWDQWCNPYIADPDGAFVSACKAAQVKYRKLDEPIYSRPDAKPRWYDTDDEATRREWFAEFNSGGTLQIFRVPPEALIARSLLPQKNIRLVIGADFGTVDAAAAALWIFSPLHHELYLAEVEQDFGLSSNGQVKFVRECARKWAEKYPGAIGTPVIAGDGGGLGKSLVLSLKEAEKLYEVDSAEKTDKVPNIRLMAGALRDASIRIVDDLKTLLVLLKEPKWDPDHIGEQIAGHMPDPVDAAYLGHRKAKELHYVAPPPPPPPDPEEELERRWQEQQRAKNNTLW